MVAWKRKIAHLEETFEVVVLNSNIFIGDKHVLKNRLYGYDNTWSWDQVLGVYFPQRFMMINCTVMFPTCKFLNR